MDRRLLLSSATVLLLAAAATATAQEAVLPVDPPAEVTNPTVGGAAMDRNMPVIDNLAKSTEHARFVEAVNAAGLASALRALGPITVFAPTDSAFSSSTYDNFSDLLKEENRGKLADLLRYHVVMGLYDTAALDARIDAGGGTAVLPTVLGGSVSMRRSVRDYTLTDATNHTAHLTVANAYQRNGVVHVIDQVLMPTTP